MALRENEHRYRQEELLQLHLKDTCIPGERDHVQQRLVSASFLGYLSLFLQQAIASSKLVGSDPFDCLKPFDERTVRITIQEMLTGHPDEFNRASEKIGRSCRSKSVHQRCPTIAV